MRPAAIGRGTRDLLDVGIRGLLRTPLVRDGQFGAPGEELLRMWKLARDPEALAAWRSSIDEAARGRGPLPADMSLEQLLLPAAGWEGRSTAQRMRLLDQLASLDGTLRLARSRVTNPRSFMFGEPTEIRAHVSRQVDRAIRGEAKLPADITVRDIQESWHFRRASRAEQVDVLRQQSASAKQAVFEEYADIRYQLGPAATEVGRYQVGRWLDHGLRTGAPLPAWIEPGDVLGASITDRQKATLLAAHLTDAAADTPECAAAQLITARIRLHAEPLGGGVPGGANVRAETLRLIDENIGRMTGTVTDGYDGHPDYAAVGRIASNLRMLDQFAQVARTSAEPPTTATGARLTW
jgi:hypothetical protein